MRLFTKGCSHYDHREFAIDYDPSVVVAPDVEWLSAFFVDSVAAGARYEARQTIRVGWSDLLIDEDKGGFLSLQEPDWTGILPTRYAPGVSRTLSDLRRQRDVANSLGIGDRILFPSVWESALTCTRLEGSQFGIMERIAPEGHDSGWFIGCDDSTHDHDDVSVLTRTSLYSIACRLPAIVEFCALPPGCTVTPDARAGVSVRLEGEALVIRRGSYLDRALGIKR